MYIVTQMLLWETMGLEMGDKKLSVRVLGKEEVKNRYKLHGNIIWRQKTLKSFIQSHKKGSFVVMVANHALTVKDGEVLDWNNNA